ncbi:hypothetical protein PC9H_001389 [Pleurotus ostreatus]|uniref:Uncharacterized protein n=1 Tax=Pleurotus ostreatus TaxID=5322 RepID=A0A8H7A2T0_PLEOS|nr:uncharacterized protein PC9H_001389 [Pleurotus ostreatus]KAF7441040.1 hypothetical protein PC9H_001389 [Pleurotus ostreatus]
MAPKEQPADKALKDFISVDPASKYTFDSERDAPTSEICREKDQECVKLQMHSKKMFESMQQQTRCYLIDILLCHGHPITGDDQSPSKTVKQQIIYMSAVSQVTDSPALPKYFIVPIIDDNNRNFIWILKMGEMNAMQLHFVEVMCESLLHGMFAVLVVVVIWLLRTHHSMPVIHKVMFIAGIVMFVLSSCHLGLVIQQVTVPDVPLKNAQAQVSIATIQFLIGDAVLIWRVWAVWNRNWWMTVVPILLALASAAVRFTVVADIENVLLFSSDIASALITVNVGLCTLLIAGRIWFATPRNDRSNKNLLEMMHRYLQRRIGKVITESPSHKTYTGIVMLLIESGTLYFLSQFISLILDSIHNPGVHTVLDMQIPLIGILPTLIVLLVHLDMVPGTRAQATYLSTVQSEFKASARRTNGSTTIGEGSRSTLPGVDMEMGQSSFSGEWKVASRSQTSV